MQDRIKALRKNLKLTQNDFGARLGVSDAAVAHWERGRQIVPVPIRLAICRVFNVNREWLETGAGEMFAAPPKVDEQELRRRFVLEMFSSLSPDQQRTVLDALRSAYEQYLTMTGGVSASSQGAPTLNTVSITAPIGGGVTIDQKIEKKG